MLQADMQLQMHAGKCKADVIFTKVKPVPSLMLLTSVFLLWCFVRPKLSLKFFQWSIKLQLNLTA